MISKNKLKVFSLMGIVVLAGCAGATNTSSPNTQNSLGENGQKVTVTEVIDGDTIEIKYENGNEDTVRLIGVDTPETTPGETSPSEFEGISNTDRGKSHLSIWGKKITNHTTKRLEGEEVTIKTERKANTRGVYDRLLAYVYVKGKSFNKELLSNGYARYYDSEFNKSSEYKEIESDRQKGNIGLWRDMGHYRHDGGHNHLPNVMPVKVSDNDASIEGNNDLNSEYIIIQNKGDKKVNLEGWEVKDTDDNTYKFNERRVISPNENITLYTGNGEDAESKVYWGSSHAIWENDDKIVIEDELGHGISTYNCLTEQSEEL